MILKRSQTILRPRKSGRLCLLHVTQGKSTGSNKTKFFLKKLWCCIGYAMNDIGGGASDHLLHNFYLLQKVIHWWNRKTPVRYVERNAKDVSKPVARHLNLPNHSRQHMAVCGLSLHLGKSESRKTLEKKIIFQIGTLNRHGILVFSPPYSHQ